MAAVRHEEYKHNGRHLVKGTEFSVRGEGRFRFMYVDEFQDRTEITGYGGKGQSRSIRTFLMDRVRTVHAKDKMKAVDLPKPRRTIKIK